MVIAISQEDADLESHGKFLRKFKTPPPFDIVADIDAKTAPHLDRTTAYLIDQDRVVRQVFPMTVRNRPSWYAVLNEIDRIN